MAVSAAAHRRLSRAFVIWKHLSDTSAYINELSVKIDMRCKHRAFVFWKYLIALRRGFSSLAIRMQRSVSKRLLHLWLARARLEKKCLYSISNRCRLRFLHYVMSSWKIVGRIDAVASSWRLKRHFAMWLRVLPVIQTEQDREGSRLNVLRSARSAFCRWRSCVQRNKRLLALLLRGQLLYCKHLLVVVWTSWRLTTVAGSLRSGTMQRLLVRRNMRTLLHAFGTWTTHLGNVRLLRRVFHAAVDRWQLVIALDSECPQTDIHVMTEHFSVWQMETRVMKQQRLLKSIYATAVVFQSIRRRRTILHSWNRWAYCRYTARKQIERARLAFLRGIVSSWSSLALNSKALVRRVEVRHRRKLIDSCFASMRAAARFGRSRRGPVARRYFGALKFYGQSFCRAMPHQHRSSVLQRLVFRAWSSQRIMSLKIALCMVTATRFMLRRRFTMWISHTGNQKRAMISHRLANAHATYSIKKRIFRSLKQRLADAALHFFLLGKAMLSNSRRCLNGGFRSWKAAAALERDKRLAPNPITEVTALPVVTGASVHIASHSVALPGDQRPIALSQSKNAGDLLPSDARAGANSEAVQHSFRAIPVTVAQGASAANPAPKTLNTASSRQRLFRENVAPRRVSAQQQAAPAAKNAEAARVTHGTQTAAPPKPKRPPLVVETVPQRPRADAAAEAFVLGRAVVSSFLLSDPRTRPAILSPLASPRSSVLNSGNRL